MRWTPSWPRRWPPSGAGVRDLESFLAPPWPRSELEIKRERGEDGEAAARCG